MVSPPGGGHSPGRAYYDRKLAEGKTPKEALRSLKRQLSDTIFEIFLARQPDMDRGDFSFPIDQEAGRQTLNLESPFHSTLWIEIDLDRFEPELVDKRLDRLAAAAVLRYRNDRDLVAEA